MSDICNRCWISIKVAVFSVTVILWFQFQPINALISYPQYKHLILPHFTAKRFILLCGNFIWSYGVDMT